MESPQAVVHGLNLLEYGLSENDVLYLTMPANRIEQLWRTSLLSLMAS
ncbi:MAG: hypothetical protein HC886_18110 [Leptolyngbyaceae cyanobacterium SM1_1_3]|nr:hypothetical protein [Leptolyngbyaceae cyanobacterium SM1_1_3]